MMPPDPPSNNSAYAPAVHAFPALYFFILAYALTWLLWLPGVLATQEVLPAAWQDTPLNILAGFGPSAAAFWLTGRRAGRAGVRQLLGRAFRFGVGWPWLALVVLGPPVLVALAVLAVGLVTGTPAAGLWQVPEFLPGPLFLPLYFLYTFIFLGPVAEEFGWRGYALDRLQARWNGLVASLILGGLWGLWHLPLFWLAGTVHRDSLPLAVFVLSAVFLSVLFTWLYNRTGRNLLAALLLHQFLNFTLFLNPAAASPAVFTTLTAFYGLAALAVVITAGSDLGVSRIPAQPG